MLIVGCDLHTRHQQIAVMDRETGEVSERRLDHESGEARAFYAGLPPPDRVGIEATGHTRWFEAMLWELGHELWFGDAAQIRASAVRQPGRPTPPTTTEVNGGEPTLCASEKLRPAVDSHRFLSSSPPSPSPPKNIYARGLPRA